MREPLRYGLLRLGRRCPPRLRADLRAATAYLELGGWLAAQPGAPQPARFDTKDDLFAEAVRHVTGERPLYLEFGVWQGASLSWWSRHLRQPGARLVGFDSFEGLPEHWRPGQGKGHFATAGPPTIDDDRVSFQVGWFDSTLPAYDVPAHDSLVVTIDCDLYSSTATVLTALEPHLRPGTLLYFDELPDPDHELRALLEHLARTGRRIEPLGVAGGGLHWLFRYL